MAVDPTLAAQLSPALLKYVSPDSPKNARLTAAKGLVPAGPAELATMLTYLLEDVDEEVKKAAHQSLLDMPTNVAVNILKEPLHPLTLDFFGRERYADERIAETVLLNQTTTDTTYIQMADKVTERLCHIVANNQVRLLRTPTIAEALRKNPNVLRSVIDAMVSFLRINGICLEGESPELTKDEIKQILEVAEPTGAGEIPVELVEEVEEAVVTEEHRKSLGQLIEAMNVSQKVKLALLGNKEARAILIKNSNKIVAASVVKSPKISDGEVITIAQMRSVHDEVIRIIAGNPEWTKHYNLQVALVNNPKTPFPVALRFVRQLRVLELQKVSKNKNISAQICKIAKELYGQKKK